jgi:tetratricopeptide (TPR) repeat protein
MAISRAGRPNWIRGLSLLTALATTVSAAKAADPAIANQSTDQESIGIRIREPAPATAAQPSPAPAAEVKPVTPPAAQGPALTFPGQPETASPSPLPAAPSTPAAATLPSSAQPPLQPIPAIPESTSADVETASLSGVTPGTTTTAELRKAWGEPKETSKKGNLVHQLYAVGPFSHVEVVCFQDKVMSVLIRLNKTYPVKTVANQLLQLAKFRPVMVSNEMGEILGQSYPEKGVLLSFEPSEDRRKPSMKVAQIILEPVSAEPFVLRAETKMETQATLSLHDIEQALKLDSQNARSHWLRARLLLEMGQLEKALEAASEALRIDPNDAQYRVTRGQILGQIGRFAEATTEAEAAIQAAQQRPHVAARAMCLLGDLSVSAARPDYRGALTRHLEALRIASRLQEDPHPAIRTAAKEVMIDANLGAAHDIAWGAWKEKDKAVPRWIEQALKLADDLVLNESGPATYRFHAYARALAACVGTRGGVNPGQWPEETLRLGRAMIDAAEDSACKARLQWDLGMALYDALQIYQLRGEHGTAMKYGELAIQYMEQSQTKQTPAAAYLLGRLYFRIGAIYAIRDKDHRAAAGWFEKALPLLSKPLPPEAVADLGRHGETFVSMGVSFWEAGQRTRGMSLTRQGVGLMEQAVKQGLLEESALTVGYRNLSVMHRNLGEKENAERYEAMAAKNAKNATR